MRVFSGTLKESESNDVASQVTLRMEHWSEKYRENVIVASRSSRVSIAADAIEYLRDRILHLITLMEN